MSNSGKYRCLRPMPETLPRKGDPTLTIEEKDGLTERPPHRQYKTPRHLLPELEKFITEMLEKGWIEPSTSEYSSPVLIIPKPPPSTKYRFVVDLRAVATTPGHCQHSPNLSRRPTKSSDRWEGVSTPTSPVTRWWRWVRGRENRLAQEEEGWKNCIPSQMARIQLRGMYLGTSQAFQAQDPPSVPCCTQRG